MEYDRTDMVMLGVAFALYMFGTLVTDDGPCHRFSGAKVPIIRVRAIALSRDRVPFAWRGVWLPRHRRTQSQRTW